MPGLEEAQAEAAQSLCDLVGQEPEAIWRDGGLAMTVSDDDGVILFSVTMNAAVTSAQKRRGR